jgi:SAM-dependent methyltransferase
LRCRNITLLFRRALSRLQNHTSAFGTAMNTNLSATWLARKLNGLRVAQQRGRINHDASASAGRSSSPDVTASSEHEQAVHAVHRASAACAGRRSVFALTLGLPLAALALLFGVSPGLFVAYLASCAACALGRAVGWPLGIAAGVTAVSLLMLVGPAVPFAVLCGAGLGAAAWKLSFWEQLEFLDDPRPWSRLRHQIDEALNVFIRNDSRRWNRMYAHGQWEFLHGPTLAPLYVAAAEFLRLRAAGGARVVDLGCGNGALLPVLRGWHRGYLGIDLSSEAVARCPVRLGQERDEEFRVGRVEDFSDFAKFDAAVFNEMLYYLSVERATAAVKKAVADLCAPATVVVVMTDNPKARRIWAALDAWHAPEQRRAFRVVPHEPVCEVRLYTPAPAARENAAGETLALSLLPVVMPAAPAQPLSAPPAPI